MLQSGKYGMLTRAQHEGLLVSQVVLIVRYIWYAN
jgi:hypothetical protein